MKEELNITAILKEKPLYTKLWSPLYGDVFFKRIETTTNGIRVLCKSLNGSFETDKKPFWKNGKYTLGGEVCLFPSKQMQDWSKFAWKKGDVLVLNNEEEKPVYCIFESFEDSEYTLFKSRFSCCDANRNNWLQYNSNSFTKSYEKASDDEAKEFIKKVEEHYEGKLDLSTLEIQKPEFKDGDIVFNEGNRTYSSAIGIVKKDKRGSLMWSILLAQGKLYCKSDSYIFLPCRPATDSEKQQLFDALSKAGKRWNPDTLQIEDLPKKYEFKAFDKVLVRDTKDEVWSPNFFSNYGREGDEYKYGCISGGTLVTYCKYCIPYNDQTAHLLGTTDEWKGGEG